MRFIGGTHANAVAPGTWDMGPGYAIRYDRPSPALAPFVSAYFMYWTRSAAAQVDWFLPAGPMLCFLVDAGPVEVAIGRRRYSCPPEGFLLGTTTRAYRSVTHGGALVGISLAPGGWARLTDRRAADFTDVLAPLSSVLGERAGPLAAAVRALADDAGLKAFADRELPALFARPHPDDALVATLSSILLTDGVTEAADAAARAGLDAEAMRRLAVRYFGMTPKRLLRRARFLRSLVTHMDADGTDAPAGPRRICSSYHDESHFLRDAAAFLGTTPRRFLRQESVFLRASVRLRSAVLGAPAMALHDPAAALAAADRRAA
jgi:hypothetical protein